jgi:carboxypeptidase C (cathepsin A)
VSDEQTKDETEHTKPAEPADDLVTTQHTLQVGDQTLAYTATAGRVVLREDVVKDDVWKGRRAKAEVGLTAYTLDDADPMTRPVMFAFNGGPGSSSVWLHLGLLGPRRVEMGDVGDLTRPPYALVDNAESLLAVSDLVFIDPVSTGWSRAAEGEKPSDFHGYAKDVEAVAEVIRLWITRNARWASPKLIAGESYGTTRAVALAEHLQSRHGMYLNGIALISAVLDFGTLDFDMHRNDRAHALYLPHYAATAHFHGKHGDRPFGGVLAEAESYAAADYPRILAKGARATPTERASAVKTIARLTGLTEDYVDRADLRIEHMRYYTELLRDRRESVGRLDSRFTGAGASGIAESMDADPSMDAILGPYATAWNHYVRTELEVTADAPYRVFADVHPWSYKEFEAKPVYVVDKLERAMRQNPHLRVHVAYGYYDGATPYSASEDVIAHLSLPEALRGNIEHRYYEAGHMMYVHQPSRVQQSADLTDFVRHSCG